MESQDIDLRGLLQLLIHRLWILLGLPIVAGITAGIISYNYLTPIYQASNTLWIKGEPGQLDYSTIIASQDLAMTYAEVARTLGVAQAAVKYLNRSGMTAEDLYGHLVATPVKGTELLRFTVTDPDPVKAADIANAFALGFKEEIERSQMVQHLYIVEEARVPSSPVKPNPRLNIMIALAIGFMAAVGLAFLLEYLDTSIRSPEDVTRRLGAPVLATIPMVVLPEQSAGKRRQKGTISPIVVAHGTPTGSAAEAFRLLRTNLQFLGLDQPLKSILVSSAVPDEGKSITSANLAVAMAHSGLNVCLVDADLRRPTQSALFGLDHRSGLTNVLVGALPLEKALAHPVECLSVLPSGPVPPNPAELLASSRMSKLLEELEDRFDMVVVDSVPALGLADAISLAPQVGGVILVVRSNGVGYPEAVKAQRALMAVNANVIGVVLDGVKENPKSYYYRKYYSAEHPKEERGD